MHPLSAYPASTVPAIPIQHAHQFYHLNEANQKFIYNGRTYTTRFEEPKGTYADTYMSAVEEPDSNSWCQFFSNLGKRRRESSISSFLIHPTERQILLDIDKSLLYRQDMDTYPLNNGYPPGVSENDSENFTWVMLWRKDKPVEALLCNRLLDFLHQQKSLGADVCITSSGGWQNNYPDNPKIKANNAWTITDFLRNGLPEHRRCKTYSFDNGASLQAKFRQKNKWYCGGAFSKFREYGNSTTIERNGKPHNYATIMIDDQYQQRFGFARSIDPKEFGTGATWNHYFYGITSRARATLLKILRSIFK